MKIGPAPPTPLPLPRPKPAGDASPGGAANRATAFTELGMFGVNRAQSAPRPGAGVTPRCPPLAPATAAPAPHQTPRCPPLAGAPPKAQVWKVAPGPVHGATTKSGGAVRAETKAPVTEQAPNAAPEAEALIGALTEGATEAEAKARAPLAAQRRPAVAAGPSVTVTEKDGVVEIAAGSHPLDEETKAALRRIAETLTAERGLDLAQFKLNGAPLAPDFLGKTGGSNGTRSH